MYTHIKTFLKILKNQLYLGLFKNVTKIVKTISNLNNSKIPYIQIKRLIKIDKYHLKRNVLKKIPAKVLHKVI